MVSRCFFPGSGEGSGRANNTIDAREVSAALSYLTGKGESGVFWHSGEEHVVGRRMHRQSNDREPSSSTVSHALSELFASAPEAIRVVTVAITLGLNGSATRNRSALTKELLGIGVHRYSHVPVCPKHPRSRRKGAGGSGRLSSVATSYDWFNNRRLHSALGHVPPAEYEQLKVEVQAA